MNAVRIIVVGTGKILWTSKEMRNYFWPNRVIQPHADVCLRRARGQPTGAESNSGLSLPGFGVFGSLPGATCWLIMSKPVVTVWNIPKTVLGVGWNTEQIDTEPRRFKWLLISGVKQMPHCILQTNDETLFLALKFTSLLHQLTLTYINTANSLTTLTHIPNKVPPPHTADPHMSSVSRSHRCESSS